MPKKITTLLKYFGIYALIGSIGVILLLLIDLLIGDLNSTHSAIFIFFYTILCLTIYQKWFKGKTNNNLTSHS